MFKVLVAITFALASLAVQAQQKPDLFSKDNRSYSEKERARSEAEAKKGYEALQREKQAEAMRDKTHDGLRYKTGKDTSIGLQKDPPGVNVRTTTK